MICNAIRRSAKTAIADETYRDQIEQARRRLSYMVDHYPPAQKTWTTACAANRQTAKD